MSDLYFLSRAYVEFGPFPSAEMLGFFDRGLLKETDYILGESTESSWLHVSEWVALQKAPVKASKAKTKTPTPKPIAKKAAPKAEPPKKVASPKAIKKKAK